MMTMQLLTDASGAGLSPATVGTILGSVILALIGGGVLGKKTGKAEGKAEAMQIGPQPFIVQLREEFATRRELEKVEATMIGHVAEMKATSVMTANKMESLFRETMGAMTDQTKSTNATIERRHKAVMEEINSVASKAYEARGRMHTTLNATREELKELKAVSNVADQLGKLADALNPQTKVQPTHPRQ